MGIFYNVIQRGSISNPMPELSGHLEGGKYIFLIKYHLERRRRNGAILHTKIRRGPKDFSESSDLLSWKLLSQIE